jgi:hypothetical protein
VNVLVGSEPIPNEELEDVYLSLANEARKNAIDPDDIRMAIKMIKEIREAEKQNR